MSNKWLLKYCLYAFLGFKSFSMSKIIWEELCGIVFHNFYLVEFVDRKRKLLTVIDVFALIFILTGILGWYKFPHLGLFWVVFLICIQLVNYFRAKFFISKEELVILDIVRSYY